MQRSVLVAFKTVFLQKHNWNTQNGAQQGDERPSEKLQSEKLAGNTRTDLDSDHEAGLKRMDAGGRKRQRKGGAGRERSETRTRA